MCPHGDALDLQMDRHTDRQRLTGKTHLRDAEANNQNPQPANLDVLFSRCNGPSQGQTDERTGEYCTRT